MEKLVKGPMQMATWQKSQAYTDLVGFISCVGDALIDTKISSFIDSTVTSANICKILSELEANIEAYPPLDQGTQRFGNKAFRQWHEKLVQDAPTLVKGIFNGSESEISESQAQELTTYLTESFGNATRIDYGTGHELSFLLFLCALFKLGLYKKGEHEKNAALNVFTVYLKLVRRLQLEYSMEPAGSQGVWALDDFQFVPFIFGAAQLLHEESITPKSIPDYELAESLAGDNHLFACIHHISKLKTGPFAEHSNQLWNISGVLSWRKVYQGLVKMYRAEVLSKFPVVQHIFFGSLFTLDLAERPLPPVSTSMRP